MSSPDDSCLGDIDDFRITRVRMISVKQEPFDGENVEFVVNNEEDFIQLQDVYSELSPVSSQRSRKQRKRKRDSGFGEREGVVMATVLSSNHGSESPVAVGTVQSGLSSPQCLPAQSPTTITVVTATPGNPATILQQNGSVEAVLDSPGDSSDGSTIQVTVSAGGGNDTDSQQNPSGDSQSGNATIVDSAHYITVTVPDTETVTGDGVAHSAYVQYVESTPDQTIYTTTNGQMAYPVYTVGESGTMYTPASGQYYTPGNTTPVTYSQVANTLTGQSQSAQNQILGNTFLIQQGVDGSDHAIITPNRSSPQTVSADVTYLNVVNSANSGNGGGASGASSGGSSAGSGNASSNSLDSDQPSLVHATRVSPATVQWLLENYETAEGVSLPRSTLYNHYLRHCYDNKLDPVNAASFGKLIRSVFLGLRTRRLGTRGNSKYHYYGIRVKPGSSLNQLSMADEGSIPIGRSSGSGGNPQKRYKFSNKGESGGQESGSTMEQNHTPTQNSAQSHNNQFLGDGVGAIPDFPSIEINPVILPEDCTVDDVDTLRSIYREHCEAFLDAILNLEFGTVESLWREFWRSQDNNGDECEEEKYLSKTKLYLLCKCLPIQQFVRRVDYLFYQNLVQVLIPDVLRPIPSSLTQAIRNFAKGLESWLTSAMVGCPQEMVNVKVTAVGAFAQTLRRYTSLNHLAQAARAVLQNSTQINQMLTDLNRVDFHNVQEQASWVCQCDSELVQRLETDFKVTLQQQNSLEEWATWLKTVVANVLKPYQGKPNFTKAARQFLLKWSFYSSMVIRDLTLRSAASFGSFHLIRLLYDEYMFYLIEHQVALATGETPIAVMGEKCESPGLMDYQIEDAQSAGASTVACNGGIAITDHSALYVTCSELHLPTTKRAKIS